MERGDRTGLRLGQLEKKKEEMKANLLIKTK
jgi:hypothetical protein